MIESDWGVPRLFKLLPFVFSILFSILALVIFEFCSPLLLYFKYSRFGVLVPRFNQRFLIELFSAARGRPATGGRGQGAGRRDRRKRECGGAGGGTGGPILQIPKGKFRLLIYHYPWHYQSLRCILYVLSFNMVSKSP